jgi:succinoglycan biosynthesis protein ExoA
MTETMPLISVCIISRGLGPLLGACLGSLKNQHNPPAFEVLVASRRKSQIEQEVRSHFPESTVDDALQSLPGGGRNSLIEKARGELILFIDDDVEAHPNLLERLARLAGELPEVGVFGGPNLTPGGSTRFQVIQGAVLGSIVTSGPIRRRYGKHPSGPADERSLILCNLAVRRSAMRPFQADLACAEENQMLLELERHGVKMRYDPELVVYHERRDTPGGFCRQVYKYGYGRGQVMRRNPRSFRLAYVAPSATCIYVAVLPALSLAGSWTLAPLAAYCAVVAAGGAKVAYSLKRIGTWAPATGLIVMVHACYGVGVMAGLTASKGKRPSRRTASVIDADAQAFEPTDI